MNLQRAKTHTFSIAARFDQLEQLGDTVDSFLQDATNLPEPESDRYMMKLAIHEIVTNIIDHAYDACHSGDIALALTLKSREFIAVLSDSGKQFDPQNVPEPDLENGQIRGYGLFLIEQLMTEVIYTPIPNGNQWRLIKRW